MTTTSDSDKLPVVAPADTFPYPEQGHWTYRDYAALTIEGQIYEIMNGVILMTPAPGTGHQEIVGEIFSYLRAHIKLPKLGQVFMSPIDVELAPDVVVQPDVVVVLNTGKGEVTPSRIIGAPDLVVEVSSPGTVSYDRREKQDAYARAGVLEYWIADPGSSTVEVFVLERGEYTSQGVFQGKAVLPSALVTEWDVRIEQFFG